MTNPDARTAGTFAIGGDIEVSRLGFGALHMAGAGSWGEPEDRDAALHLLRRLPELGVDFIDTADSYGPDVSEQLIREALHPYDGLLVTTKAGSARPGRDAWVPLGRPEYLIQQAHKSLRNLGVERIDLWQLHRIDPKVPADEQYDAIRTLIDTGIVRHAGLSEAKVADIQAASRYFKVATVQNLYNLVDRTHEDVLEYCAARGIGFIPWFPLASGELARPDSILGDLARKHGATSSQIALAWLLKRSQVVLPIPGTSKLQHLEENVAAAGVMLSDEDFVRLDAAGRDVFAGRPLAQGGHS